ncbi:MAG TPA: OmpA family protein [Chitinophagaceae bacterium]|nr:OmpA family protein [Chitinophagaceae bacterium]
MKKIILLVLPALLIFSLSDAQLLKGLADKAKAKINQRANNKVDNTMDKGLDEVEGKNVKKVKTDEDGDVKIKTEDGDKVKIKGDNSTSLSYTSKYDFVPGEKVVAYEDFSTASVGDFPVNWNTNATAEVVTLNNKEGKWLKIQKEGIFHPELIKSLPDNFTLELDLGVNNDFDSKPFVINIGTLTKPADYTDYGHYVEWRGRPALHLEFNPYNGRVSAWSRLLSGKDGNHHVNNTADFKGWDNSKNTFAHISLWRQKERLRVYLNGEKVWDSPKAFLPEGKYNAITFAMQGSYRPEDFYVMNNMRLAVGAADTRNKLITEGKFVTRGILFDVNSDRIKPESAGALKDIANVLKENADVKVKIVGHTDADGDDAKNLDLSKRRAASVKSYLVKEHGISAGNLETDGKGESAPVDKNTTAEGKANNRRVEFIKM